MRVTSGVGNDDLFSQSGAWTAMLEARFPGTQTERAGASRTYMNASTFASMLAVPRTASATTRRGRVSPPHKLPPYPLAVVPGGGDWPARPVNDESATLATPPEQDPWQQAHVSDNPGGSGYWRRHQRLRSLPIIPSNGAPPWAWAGLGLVLFAPSGLCASVDCRREDRPWARPISRPAG
ncbi:uncharacterized protein B0I36DRAFT_405777 [Microdochium trichocladiopsis]|uniref:Uncharacterized protein n=1 Tax=Microdochium trichocladiopsis TaxID=1682393 RepID=A0A9P9BT39_9PEZI|nr:uncharacterized protein B0I36DRAFT_405777 [Microdochium trichocladiopsis]KAH7035234.1 hypothetical protein B0I36DRAFT_405777 [Microdochium trichocladiopsis]